MVVYGIPLQEKIRMLTEPNDVSKNQPIHLNHNTGNEPNIKESNIQLDVK